MCVCVHIDFVDGLAQESDPEGNHLVIWPFDHFLTDQSCLDVGLPIRLPASRASRPWQAFKNAGAGDSLPHRRGVSGKTTLHCDRRDSQLTESVRAPDADGPAFSVGTSSDQKKGRRREGRGEAGLTRRDKAAPALSGPKLRRPPADSRRAGGESGS